MEEIRCSNPDCKNTFFKVHGHTLYCGHSCAAHITNTKRTKTKNCPKCNITFNGARKYCSMKCVPITQPKYSKEFLINQILEFHHKNNRIPLKSEFNTKNWHAYYRTFGSWNKSIEAAGLKPNEEKFSKKYTAMDGHYCDSLAEKIIDDWLFRHKIFHQNHICYPNQKRFKTDFFIENKYWLEFVGLRGQFKRYDYLYSQKRKMIKRKNLDSIELLPTDLFPTNKLSEKLAFLLK